MQAARQKNNAKGAMKKDGMNLTFHANTEGADPRRMRITHKANGKSSRAPQGQSPSVFEDNSSDHGSAF